MEDRSELLLGKQGVFVTNLPQVMMAGLPSEAMMLFAKNEVSGMFPCTCAHGGGGNEYLSDRSSAITSLFFSHTCASSGWDGGPHHHASDGHGGRTCHVMCPLPPQVWSESLDSWIPKLPTPSSPSPHRSLTDCNLKNAAAVKYLSFQFIRLPHPPTIAAAWSVQTSSWKCSYPLWN